MAAACGQAPSQSPEPVQARALYPEIEPFDTGTLRVSDLHEIYYERSGNPDGRPVMVLHGGPGVGSYPRLRRYFDPEAFHIVIHDQRGAGRSTPAYELRENTTWDLVEDIERLRVHLDLGKVVIFGGSWGSTLGLAYAESYPENVQGMVLRGIFTGTTEEMDHHYHEGAARFFPAEYAALLDVLPDPERRPLPPYLREIVLGEDEELRNRVMDRLMRFEIRMSTIEIPDEALDRFVAANPPDLARQVYAIDLHYSSNRYFLEEDQLVRDAPGLADVPAVLISGRYDVNCPPAAAWRLHQALPDSEWIVVERAGHSEREPGVTAALLEAMERFR